MKKAILKFGAFRDLTTATIAALLATACVDQHNPPAVQNLNAAGAVPAHLSGLPAPGSPEAVGSLLLANDCQVAASTMVDEAGLYSQAAGAIVKARAGTDGVCGTVQDRIFKSLDDILDLPYVGPRNLERLVFFAKRRGAAPSYAGGTIEGVHFTDAEAFNALFAANGASFETLHQEAALRSDAVRNIIDARPMASLEELAQVYRVGPSTLEQLRNWSSPRVQGSFVLDAERYEGMEPEAYSFLFDNEVFAWDLVQFADYDDTALGEIESSLAAELSRRVETRLFGRPFRSADEALDAVLQTASSIQRQVRVEGWQYLQSL